MSSDQDSVRLLNRIGFGPEIRKAELYTEFEIGGHHFAFNAAGARSCSVNSASLAKERTTLEFSLACDATWFEAEHPALGPIRIFQDPRIENLGWIYARRTESGNFEVPALSYFNQHLIFHIGNRYFYYPRAWQVISAIAHWPPEFHQYHHLEPRTPVFDLITRAPNVAIKGISTINILGPLHPAEEQAIRTKLQVELDLFNKLPATVMPPEDLTPIQV